MSEFAVAEETEEKSQRFSIDAANPVGLDAASAFASWNFDSLDDFFSNPPSPLLLSPSMPSLSISNFALSILSPAASPRIFDDSPSEIAGIFDSEKEEDNLQNKKIRSFPIPSIKEASDISYLIKGRMMQALRYFKEWTSHRVLVQVWVPVRNGDRYVLTTSEQPFVLDPGINELLQYRTVSSMYLFSLDENNDGALGLPGRVFKLKQLEWTPNVQYYSSKEYPRLSHALLYNVRGSLGLPVFEPSRQSCIGVVELIMTSEIVNYAPEVDKVCRALEAVNLRSCKILEHKSSLACNEGRQAALAEILEILTVVCEALKLPLAQTWVPCQHDTVPAQHAGSEKSFSISDGSCMSTSDAAFYVVDSHVWGFRDACSEHHLLKGEGVVGRAFAVKRPCFCSDITKFSKTEYPLVHYAQMFGLGSCLALCLRSYHSEDDIYVIEFFFPSDCKDPIKQHALLESISTLMRQSFQSLKLINGTELELPFEMMDMNTCGNHEMKHNQYELLTINTLEGPNDHKYNADHDTPGQNLANCVNPESNTTLPGNVSISASTIVTNKVAGRKRGKAEKLISLEVLKQYFAVSLKDAAKSLGVCRTTMKRICRRHGISRWPSRKINKVNRSISKLKQDIESVPVAEVAVNLNPLVCPLPVAPGSMPFPVKLHRDSVARDEDPSHFKTLGGDDTHHKLASKEPVDAHISSSSKTKSSSEGTIKTPVLQCPNDNSLVLEACGIEKLFPANSEQYERAIRCLEEQNTVSFLSLTGIIVEPEHANAGTLLEDSASSKLVRNPPSTLISERKSFIMKACYKEDIARFRLASDNYGFRALNEEIGKRLMLDVGTFDVKYLDEDNDWVKLSCDEDLEECLEISALLESSVIRLSVEDICAKSSTKCIDKTCIL